MNTFYDICFKEIKERVEGNGARSINYDEVDRLVVEWAKFMEEHPGENMAGAYILCVPPPHKKPRKTRKDKGVKKGGDRPLEEETTG